MECGRGPVNFTSGSPGSVNSASILVAGLVNSTSKQPSVSFVATEFSRKSLAMNDCEAPCLGLHWPGQRAPRAG